MPTIRKRKPGVSEVRVFVGNDAVGCGRLGHANPAMTLRTYADALDGADTGVDATLVSALEVDDATT